MTLPPFVLSEVEAHVRIPSFDFAQDKRSF